MELAAEMGNSPSEIIDSYKRNVSDKEAESWFAVMPPEGYTETIKAALSCHVSLQGIEPNKGIDV